MVDWLNRILITKEKLEMDALMVKEIIRISKDYTMVNGEMTWGMELDKKSLKIEKENMLVISLMTNMKEEENLMINSLFMKVNLRLVFMMEKDWWNIKTDKYLKDLSKKIKGCMEDILFLMALIMKVHLEIICLMEMVIFTGQMV